MENNTYEKYLPIGTVVMLKGASKRVMITGFCNIDESNKDKVYDYSGCVYPEGVISSKQTLLFDHSQIDKVYFVGYDDDENKQFQTKLKNLMNDINKKNN